MDPERHGDLRKPALRPHRVGFVIPTLNEAARLPRLLEDLASLSVPIDVVVCDGGSMDRTIRLARSGGARVTRAPRGRAQQMNAGAREVQGDWLCFLHADVRFGPDARRDLEAVVADSTAEAAVWRLGIDAAGIWARVVEWGAAVRDRVAGLAYGDQGLLVRRRIFEDVGGFPDLPIMEDIAMIRTLGRVAAVQRLRSSLRVSPRRWRREGPVLASLRNAALVSAYAAGVAPSRLARWYQPERE